MINQKLIKSLEQMINEASLDETLFPVQRGNNIQIKNYRIYAFKNKYVIKTIDTKERITETFCKASALAIAKNLARNKHFNINQIKYLDKKIEKHFFDSLFYRNTINNTKDSFRRDIIETRLDIAIQETAEAKNNLDRFIFES
jgi:hypothetical protein